jgi:hypothetical protein
MSQPHISAGSSRALVSLLLLFIPGAFLRAAPAEGFVSEFTNEATSISWKYNRQPVLKYQFAATQYKPYVSELYTTRGMNVLRDAPADHHHHHALMYGIKVKDVNFWEEASGSGVQRVIKTETSSSMDGARPTAVIRQELIWVPAQDAFLPMSLVQPLLVEHRKLTLYLDTKTGETALLWHAVFEVPGRTNTVTLTGSNYHGLGMRFLAEFDPVGLHLSPRGNPDLSKERHNVERHPWEAVLFNSAEKPAAIAIFGSPSNLRGESSFFAMRNPFVYISATQGLDKEPLRYKSGDRFELAYLVTLYPEIKTAEALSARWDRYKTSGK